MNEEKSQQLPRVLGPWMATAIVVGTVIGSGVFKKPQQVATNIPEFGMAMLAWVLGGLLAVLGALSLAEVAVRFPRAGGNYVFLREGYGRMAGFLWGWVEFWIIRSASIGALASIFTESFHDVLREAKGTLAGEELLSFWARQWVTVIVIVVLSLVNARGTTWGGLLQLIVTTVKILSLLSIALMPFIVSALTTEPTQKPNPELLQPIFPAEFSAIDWGKFGAGLVGVLWAYHGWMNIAPVAEEVRNPSRNIPLALISGTTLIICLYLSVNLAYYLMIPRTEMAALNTRPVASEFSYRLLGNFGLLFASAAIMTSVFGSLNGNLLVGPRLLFAMSKDRLAPESLCRLHPKYQTPAIATMILAGWSVILVLGAGMLTTTRLPTVDLFGYTLDINVPKDKILFDVVTDFAMFGAISFETLAVASIFVFRYRYGSSNLPYRCPLYPIIPMLYVLVMIAVLVNMFTEQRTESLIGVGFIFTGIVVYLSVFAGRGKQL